MNKVRFGFFISLLWLLSVPAQAAIETYEFEDDLQRAQYGRLTEELRCPKCQNQNIADSNAPIAKDMREKVYAMTKQGMAEDDIVQFMVDRFGDFVMYEPRFAQNTWLLWVGPAIFALLGVVVVVMTASRRKAVSTAVEESPLTADQQDALKKILSEDEK